ncbi:MAG: lactoylglutathione lyase [Oxalobacteraceae bacterium]|nr:lactoylglutathione lyase [Oxalobacteraceae bacterium]
MKYLHTMVRVSDLDASIKFYRDALGLEVLRSQEYPGGRFTLVFLAAHVYALCERLQSHGVTILRPPRDGRMAFVRSPDNVSIELLQRGQPLPPAEPWVSMPNTGTW